MRNMKRLWKCKHGQWKHFFVNLHFLATFLHLRKQRDQILTIGPSPVHGLEHRHSTELAPALE